MVRICFFYISDLLFFFQTSTHSYKYTHIQTHTQAACSVEFYEGEVLRGKLSTFENANWIVPSGRLPVCALLQSPLNYAQ